LRFETDGGLVRLRIAKACVRCTIPNVDPTTAEGGDEPLATLTTYRADARVDNGITFGMNAVIVEGIECMLKPGLSGAASIRF
jgi:uncharacterized protein